MSRFWSHRHRFVVADQIPSLRNYLLAAARFGRGVANDILVCHVRGRLRDSNVGAREISQPVKMLMHVFTVPLPDSARSGRLFRLGWPSAASSGFSIGRAALRSNGCCSRGRRLDS